MGKLLGFYASARLEEKMQRRHYAAWNFGVVGCM